MIEFCLDGRSGVSLYLQVVHQVRQGPRLGSCVRATGRLVAARPGIGTFVTRPYTSSKRTPGIGDGSSQRKHNVPPAAATSSVGRRPIAEPRAPPATAPSGRTP
jgi:hypothetical protein